MLTYEGSRLAVTSNRDSRAVRRVLNALRKRVRIDPSERFFMEVEISVPRDVKDLGSRSSKVLMAGAVVKLVKQLKIGPLRHCKNDMEYLDGAIEFLATDDGERWVRSWFLPAENERVSHEAKTSNAQSLETPLEVQSLEIPLEAVSSTSPPRDTGNNIRYLRPTYDTTFVKPSSNIDAELSVWARVREVTVSMAQPGTGVYQHRRAQSDSSPLSLSPRYEISHYKSYGVQFRTVLLPTEILTLRAMEGGCIAKHEKWTGRIVRCCFNSLLMLATLLIIFLLAQLMVYLRY